MEVTSYLELTDGQIDSVRALVHVCNEHEKLNGEVFFSNRLNYDTNIRCYYCMRADNRLIGFLSAFIPTKDVAEISAYVHPDFRQKGIFAALLSSVCEELLKYSIQDILFITQPQAKACEKVLGKFSAKKDHSEYLMEFRGEAVQPMQTDLCLRMADLSDREMVIMLSEAAFEESPETAQTIADSSLRADNIDIYLAYMEECVVGTMSTNREGDELFIYGVAVLPEFQRKGYGRQMLNLLMRELTKPDRVRILIEADSKKPNAYGLYQKSGFDIITEFDYFRYRIEKGSENH